MTVSETLTPSATVKAATSVLSVATGLRASEKLILIYLTYVSAAASFFRVSVTQGLTIATLNLASGGVIALVSRFSADRKVRERSFAKDNQALVEKPGILDIRLTPKDGKSELLRIIRDCFPAIVILLAYREAGLLGLPDPSHRLDYLFVGWDRALLQNRWVLVVLQLGAPWLQRYLEFCYSLCYPLVPLGLGALCLLGEWPRHGSRPSFDTAHVVDHFWTTVLLALFTCYALFPLFPSTTPRLLFQDLPGPVVAPLFRKVNFWILGRYGIQSSVFPSGHVAAVTATALAVRAHWPRAGIVFAIAAVSIALATIVGRYHYAADAAAGALIGVAAFLVSRQIHKS